MALEACCTCASLLAAVPRVSASSEKPLPDHRQLDCCSRIICGDCIHTNPRFLAYCPYCQTSGRSPRTSRPRTRPQREKESESEPDTEADSNPPPYSAVAAAVDTTTPTPRSSSNNSNTNPPPPPYTQHQPPSPPATPPSKPASQTTTPNPPTPSGYTLHHLVHPPHPNPDTLPSLSLRYGIPARTLLSHNNIPPDAGYLLAARHTLLIPTAYITTTTTDGKIPPPNQTQTQNQNQTLSLSPSPVENEAERQRKVTLRRFMVACKEADYDAAVVYLEESGYDLDEAVGQYLEDAEWEREHPLPLHEAKKGKGKGRARRKGDGKAAGVGTAGGRMGWFKGLVK